MENNSAKELYLFEILEQMPRLLGMLDRNIASSTYGSFDRQYWHYNTTDFSCARSQEAVLALALAYKINHPKNPYYNNESVLEWINAALDFWAGIQAKNGTFSEWYPNENSFVATAFSTYAISETLLILGNKIKSREHIIKSLEKACDWVLSKRETRAQNQESGCIAGMHNAYLLTKKKKYLSAAKEKLNFMRKSQKGEGWFSEYGGFDVGYLSLAIDYLAKYYKKSGDRQAEKILDKSIAFIKYFIHPDFTAGGEYGSRNTEYLIPDGFEIMSKENNDAKIISNHILSSIKNRTGVTPFSLDERYLLYNGYTYFQAYLDYTKKDDILPPYSKNFSKYFRGAGAYVLSNDNFYLIANLKKGGAFKICFKKSNSSASDSGISIITKNSRLTASWPSNSNKISISGNKISVEGSMWELTAKTLTPGKNIMLRLFQATVGKHENIGMWIKNSLRTRLITSTTKSHYSFRRIIKINHNNIEIQDEISNIPNMEKIILNGKESYIYVPSSRYFSVTQLKSNPLVISIKNKKNNIKITRNYSDKGKLSYKVE